ncbi:MAG TPA: DUF2065 domain-containing protein [Burkholderiaceae bacterium]|nr:DUF2065 domain-containing protein [Burkholderiaceae bacterium]
MVPTLTAAFAVMLVLEGALPLLAPRLWRRSFERLLRLRNGQIRFFGLASVALGALLLLVSVA